MIPLAFLWWTALTWPLFPASTGRNTQLLAPTVSKQPADSPLLDSLLRADARLRPIMQRAGEYELQIIYTQINRDAQQRPHFVRHTYRVNDQQYFNPASLVKLPTAVLALEKLNDLGQPGLISHSPMATGASFRCQTPAPYNISPNADRTNTVGNYIKRMLLVSDNQAYNRLYEFLGQRPLNERLAQLGYPTARIVRRFAPCDTAANRYTNPIEFLDPATGRVCYRQPAAYNSQALGFPLGRITKGRAYQVGGRIIPEPYDFTTANYLPLQACTEMLKAVLFPETLPVNQRFRLTPDDYAFLRQYLRQTPRESGYTLYASSRYFDAYKKYLVYGRSSAATLPAHIHIHNVVGMSHGYLADVAYVADSAQRIEFMLSAVLYVNKDGVLNDGIYEYESVGLPFLAALGQNIYAHEARRPRRVAPELAESFSAQSSR